MVEGQPGPRQGRGLAGCRQLRSARPPRRVEPPVVPPMSVVPEAPIVAPDEVPPLAVEPLVPELEPVPPMLLPVPLFDEVLLPVPPMAPVPLAEPVPPIAPVPLVPPVPLLAELEAPVLPPAPPAVPPVPDVPWAMASPIALARATPVTMVLRLFRVAFMVIPFSGLEKAPAGAG